MKTEEHSHLKFLKRNLNTETNRHLTEVEIQMVNKKKFQPL